MSHTELETYIKNELAKGVPAETLRTVLIQTGWRVEDIDTAFIAAALSTQKKKGWDTKYNFLAFFFLLNLYFVYFFNEWSWMFILEGIFLILLFIRKTNSGVLGNKYVKGGIFSLIVFGVVGYIFLYLLLSFSISGTVG